MMRKAALLFEVGRDSEAKELNTKALQDARSVPDSDTDVAAKSREAWALCMRRGVIGLGRILGGGFESRKGDGRN